jgi:transcriptional regulator with XRE-family HTH domain
VLIPSPAGIRQARLNAGMSREQVAAAIHRSFTAVVRFENGTVTPSARTLGLLATALRVSVADLFEEVPL